MDMKYVMKELGDHMMHLLSLCILEPLELSHEVNHDAFLFFFFFFFFFSYFEENLNALCTLAERKRPTNA